MLSLCIRATPHGLRIIELAANAVWSNLSVRGNESAGYEGKPEIDPKSTLSCSTQ
jgi:hypothetical protein